MEPRPFPIIICLLLTLGSAGGSWYQDKLEGTNEPSFKITGSILNVTAVEGRRASLICSVSMLQDRQVSWIRKEKHPVILSSGTIAFTSDNRVSVSNHPATQDWELSIDRARTSDSGPYECQVNTDPKLNLGYNLRVVPAAAVIQGEQAVYVKPGSSISLSCTISLYSVPPASIHWFRDGRLLNLGSPRGGVSLENEKTPQYTRSTLLVTRAVPDDSGNYTCTPTSGHPASVTVHVLDGENPRAMQRGDVSVAVPGVKPTFLHQNLLILLVLYLT
ncbi:lachesin [Eurytemora carolleeae]|uniref:lachesin n=1 Tax=Eurytemora carolleeae TaxID=1294199 RepID=UPI000C7707B1|nr:lachesin [Eurytemora carolleeae]|eukprot:XP_023341264.1 lachesin-like [Eurytemora affinis]